MTTLSQLYLRSLTSSEGEVGAEFVQFFHNLYGSSKPTLPLDSDVVLRGPCLSNSSSEILLAPVTCDTIRKALFGIGNDKAPGLDGYTSHLFKSTWPIIGDDFCGAVQDFFRSGKLLKQINHAVISLIPKSAHVASPGDFRPISCCNVIYKVISKILADRLVLF